MFVIGITGGVGSGKSLVAKIARKKYNASLLIADELGHIVMEPGNNAYNKIIERFGRDILGDSSKIDRNKLADIVFNNDKERLYVNGIIHPEVIKYIERYINERKNQNGYIILETAVMYETGCDRFCNEIWYVHTPADTRIKRLSKNRGYTEEKSRQIIGKQKPDKFFMERAGRIIENPGSIKDLENIINSLPDTLKND